MSPILHLGLEPILVDYDLETHNIDVNQVMSHISKASAIIFAHTLGNPVVSSLMYALAEHYHVPIIEDCCEAVGAKYKGRYVGSCSTLGTYSFYPSHQMTALGGGGMVVTNDNKLILKLKSLRDWGKVWDWESGLTDYKTKYDFNGYFKQYTYETLGYNMKLPEANAAFGRVQLKRLDGFRQRRIENYTYLRRELTDLKDKFYEVDAHYLAEASWFGYPLTLKDGDRNKFSDFLESKGIRTRPFFAGNLTKHKPFIKYKQDFPVADKLMRDSLFIGVWQGITKDQLDYVSEVIHEYFTDRR